MAFKKNSRETPMPTNEEHILFLIAEELKSRKFFNTLQDLGLDDSWYQPHLDEAILTCLGLNDNTNETFDFYYAVMNEHAALIDKSPASIEEQARVVYVKLVLRK